MRSRLRQLAVAGLLFLALASGLRAAPARVREDRILIVSKIAQKTALSRMHTAERATVFRRFAALGNIEVLELPRGVSAQAALTRYRQSGLVEFAEPDHWFTVAATPDDPSYVNGAQWNLHNLGQRGGVADADIDASEAWDTYHSATNIIVAVIDSGARYTHEDLAANLWINPDEIAGNGFDDDLNGIVDDVHGINAIVNSGDPFDDTGHGTHVTGIAGAVGNNGKGIAGVCWGVRLMICKFLNNAGGSESDLIQCLDYARARGARVINCSFVSPDFSVILSNAFWNVRNSGIVVVAAAGNSGSNNDTTPQYPASYKIDNIIAVTATTRTDGFAGYNYGANSVHLAAPGYQIYSTWNGHDADYDFLSGTSMSAPQVASGAALLWSRFPSSSYHDIVNRLLATVDPLPGLAGRCITGGRLNLGKALGPPLQADFTPSQTSGLLPLTVNFTNTSFGGITNYSWDFGDGSPSSDVPSPEHLFVNAGTYNVTLTVSGTNGGVSMTNRVINAVGNYQIQAATFDWVPTNGMTLLALGGNGVSGPHALPFTFRLYNQDYSQGYVSANGLIGFINVGLGSGANADAPNTAAPNGVVCPYWDDLNPAAGGSVWFGTFGVSPNRKVVASWIDVPHANLIGQETRFTFQVILHESQQVTFQYLEVESGRGNLISGNSATIGLEDSTGGIAENYTFNGNPATVTNNQALLFVPYGSGSTAPSLTQPVLASGQLDFRLFGAPMQSYVVQASSNLTHWLPVVTNLVPASGAMGFSDPGAASQPRRFYRAVTGQ